MQLKDKVTIITGGCQGLGRAMGEYLANKGIRLVLADLNRERLGEAVAACKVVGGDARAYVCNVVDEEQVTHMAAQVVSDFGAIDGLVNNVGILRGGLTIKVKDGQLSKTNLTQWQPVTDVNLTGVFFYTCEVVAKMIGLRNGDAIVNISSISRTGNMGQTNYSVVKAGVVAGTMAWMKEPARYGIRVVGVAPGFIETEMAAGMKSEALEKMTAGIPLKCMGKPVEIVHSVAYIFRDDYYTGCVLEPDGDLRL